MSKYTKGPWFVDVDKTVRENNNPDSEIAMLICRIDGPMDTKEQKANAQLIAAAPELLAKLENLYRRLRQTSEKGTCGRDEIAKVIYTQKEIDEIDKLLAKAKGEV